MSIHQSFPIDNKPLYVLFALALFFGFFYHIGQVALFDLDEGAFSQATREMFVRGDFLSTYLNGVPRHDKPILSYWLQAVSVSLFGFNEFAFRLPSALASSAWAVVIFLFTRRIMDTRRALLAATIMATSLAVTVIGKAATADALLNLFLAISLFSLYLHLHEKKQYWLYLAAVAMGLGFLTKGPIAIAIPTSTSLLYCLIQGQWRAWLQMLINKRAWLLFLLIALPWYLIQFLRNGEGFLQGFFLQHNLGRFQKPMEGHSGHWWYYFPVLLVSLLPYTTVLLRTLTRLRHHLAHSASRYLLIGFTLVFVLFSLAATKLPHYIIYGYSGLFILIAVDLDQYEDSSTLLLLPLFLFFGLLLALPTLVDIVRPQIQDEWTRIQLSSLNFSARYYILLLTGLPLILYFMIEQSIQPALKAIISGVLFSFILYDQVLPTVANTLQQPVKEAGLLARQYPHKAVMWRLNMPSFSVYSGQIVERREPQPGDLVFTKSTALTELGKHELLYQRHGIALALVSVDRQSTESAE